MSNQPIFFIGIAGASASGKTLLAHTIFEELVDELGNEDIGIIREDCYYRDQSHLTMDERIQTNYDHPNAMDHDLLIQHIKDLKQGKNVDIPEYSYSEHTRMAETIEMTPKKVIILEGILLYTDPKIRELLDVMVFMDTAPDICLSRRILRDVQERGRTVESVLGQYKDTVRPMFQQFIEPSKRYADVIVPRGGKNRIVIDMLKAKIREKLA